MSVKEPETQNVDVLKANVRSALIQFKYAFPMLQDRARGTQIIYSVDTDVVKLFTSPMEMAAASGESGDRPGYLQLFEDDNREECIARGRVVANHIFRNLNDKGVPLIIFPPLTRELEGIHKAVSSKAHEQQISAFEELRKLKDKFDKIRAAGDVRKLYKLISDNSPRLAELMEGEGDATAELRRFTILFREKLVAAPGYIAERKIFKEPILLVLAPAENNLALDFGLYQFREKWADALKGSPNQNRKKRDAAVLARIQQINRLLPDGYKLVHVTGDAHILAAGENIKISDEPGSLNFTEAYLRHPRAFLSAPQILFKEKRGGVKDGDGLRTETDELDFSEFTKWLIVFLAKFWETRVSEIYDSIRGESAQLDFDIKEDEIANFCKKFPDLVSEFRAHWQSYSIEQTTGLVSKMADDMPYMKGLSGNLIASFAEVEDQISQHIQETWRGTFQSVLATSYGLMRTGNERDSSKNDVRSRSVPLISCGSFPMAQDFITEVIEAKSLETMGQEKYLALLDTIKQEQEDSVGYSYDLAYATLFAAEGRWALARILAERAFANCTNSEDSRISGREAAYYSAVAIRNTARKAKDLDVAKHWIERAKSCVKKDRQSGDARPAGVLRFDVEVASLNLAAQFMEVFKKHHPTKNDVKSLRPMEEEFQRLLVLVQQHLGEDAGSNDPAGQHENWINRNLERKILVNLLMISLIREFSDEEGTSEKDVLKTRENFDLLAKISVEEIHPEIQKSYLYDVVWKLASLRFVKDKTKIREIKKELETKLLGDKAIKQHNVMPYDKNRLEFFRGIISKVAEKPF